MGTATISTPFSVSRECRVSHVSLRGSRCSMTCHRVMTSKLPGAKSFNAVWGFTSSLKCSLAKARACALFSTASTCQPRRCMASDKVTRSPYPNPADGPPCDVLHGPQDVPCVPAYSCAPSGTRSSSPPCGYRYVKCNQEFRSNDRFQPPRESLA